MELLGQNNQPLEQEEEDVAVSDLLKITYSGNKGKILDLLGNGIGPEAVAAAIGVSPSYISQLLSQKEFAMAVTARRYNTLQQHNIRDSKLDKLEDALIKKMEDLLPMMFKPAEVMRAFQLVNGAKRRGTGASQEANTIINGQVVNLVIPPQLVHHFTRDINNQVIEVQEKTQPQTLVTMQSSSLKDLVAKRDATRPQLEGPQDVLDPTTLTAKADGTTTKAP